MSVTPGTYCVAFNNTLKQWHRCEVLKVSELHAEIRYIDIGATEIVLVTDLKIIHSQFKEPPRFVANCSLFNVIPNDRRGWNESAFKSFSYLIDQQKVTFNVRNRDANNIYQIDMCIKDTNIAQELIKEGNKQTNKTKNKIKFIFV